MFLEFDSTHYRYFSKKFKFFFQIFSYFYSKIFVFWAYLVKNEYFRILFENIRKYSNWYSIFEYFRTKKKNIRKKISNIFFNLIFVTIRIRIRFEIRIFSNIFIFEIRIVRAYSTYRKNTLQLTDSRKQSKQDSDFYGWLFSLALIPLCQ